MTSYLVHVYTKCQVKAFKQHAIFVTEKTHTKTISVTEKNTYKNGICDKKHTQKVISVTEKTQYKGDICDG